MLTIHSLGGDPEVFLVDANGGPVSAHTMPFGDKHNPSTLSCGTTVSIDGTALEVGLLPARSWCEFQDARENAKSFVHAFADSIGCRVATSPVAHYPDSMWRTVPMSAKRLGCSRDYTISGDVKGAPKWLERRNFRYAGGHLHFGVTANDIDVLPLVREVHEELSLLPLNADEEERLRAYGSDGAFRYTKYGSIKGFEYRALSGRWLTDDETFDRVVDKLQQFIQWS